jgi:hypothetical protein
MSIFDDDSVRDKELEESILVAKFLKEFQEKFAKEIDKEIFKTLYELGNDNHKI